MDDIKAIWLKKIDEKVACKNMKEGGFSPALIVATSFHCGGGWIGIGSLRLCLQAKVSACP